MFIYRFLKLKYIYFSWKHHNVLLLLDMEVWITENETTLVMHNPLMSSSLSQTNPQYTRNTISISYSVQERKFWSWKKSWKPERHPERQRTWDTKSAVIFAFILCPPEHGCAYKNTHSNPVLQAAIYLKLCTFANDRRPTITFLVIQNLLCGMLTVNYVLFLSLYQNKTLV